MMHRFMEKLLEGATVEWRKLGEVGKIIRGNGMQKKDFMETGFPAIHYGQIYTKFGLSAERVYTFVSNEFAKKLRIAQTNDLLIATTSENDEDVLKPLAWLGSDVAISGDMMMLKHNENVKYLAYYFQSEYFQRQKTKYITGAKIRRISKDNLEKMEIPIPPLKVQREIVRILDNFTELTAELSARRKQYSYYRDKLLSFDEDEVEWKTLGSWLKILIQKESQLKADLGNPVIYLIMVHLVLSIM